MASRATLIRIRNADPSGWEYTEPTDQDYHDFGYWVTKTYGAKTLSQYYSEWDCLSEV